MVRRGWSQGGNRRQQDRKGAFQVALVVKNLPANARDVRNAASIPGLGRSLGRGHDNYSILAWRIPLTEEPGRLQSIGSNRVRHN